MKNNEQTKKYYDDFSSWYENERHHGYHAMLDRLELEVVKPLALDGDVLEVGAGTGLIMQGLSESAHRIVGLDISSGMLKKASNRGFEVVKGSATDLPFDEGQFDLVYSFKVLAHVPEIQKALKEMSRVLRPGGYMVAEFYNTLSLRRLAKWLGGPGKISADRTEAEVFTRWDTPSQVRRYLPENVAFEAWRGVRVITPFAMAFRLPMADMLLPAIETYAMKSPMGRFGGFLLAICKKV